MALKVLVVGGFFVVVDGNFVAVDGFFSNFTHIHIHLYTYSEVYTPKRGCTHQDAGLEYDLFTWNSAISTLEKRRRWQEHLPHPSRLGKRCDENLRKAKKTDPERGC